MASVCSWSIKRTKCSDREETLAIAVAYEQIACQGEGLSRLLDGVRNRGNAREDKGDAFKWILTLVAAASLFATTAVAQDKPFFSAQYPAAGVSLSSATPIAQGSVPGVKNPRVVSSDDVKDQAEPESQTITPRAPNLTQFGVDFDRRHPELFTAQPGLETVKQQLNEGEGTPTPTSSPSPSPTPLRIKVGRRVHIVNPNSNLQPGANPTATPIVIVVQPSN